MTSKTYRGVKIKHSLPLICEGEQVKFILKYRGIVYTVNKVIWVLLLKVFWGESASFGGLFAADSSHKALIRFGSFLSIKGKCLRFCRPCAYTGFSSPPPNRHVHSSLSWRSFQLGLHSHETSPRYGHGHRPGGRAYGPDYRGSAGALATLRRRRMEESIENPTGGGNASFFFIFF